jgi:predicted nucleotidyltransferase
MDSRTFGELIRKRRLDLEKPIREVAGAIGVDQSILSKIERNKLVASAKIIPALSKILSFDFKDLQTKYWSEKIYNELKGEEFGIESVEIVLKRLEKEQGGTSKNYKKEKLIEKIKDYVDSQPIDRVWLFGSFARDEASYDSDIDLLVKFDNHKKIDLFDYIGIRQDLEDLTGRQIDLVEEGQELASIKPIIEKEKKLIYERQPV